MLDILECTLDVIGVTYRRLDVRVLKALEYLSTEKTISCLSKLYRCLGTNNIYWFGSGTCRSLCDVYSGLGEDKSLIWVEGDAEQLKFGDDSMDGYTVAFGIRNVTHIEKALAEAYRVLKPGGRFLCLELSHVELPIFKDLYDYYSFSVIPAVGEIVAGDRESYQYLVESIRRFPKQEKFTTMIAEAGFQKVEYENLVGGVVAIHSGLKF